MSVPRLITPEDIRRLRKLFKLTQRELAIRAGVSQSLIARIEAGTVDPRLSTLGKIMRVLTAPEHQKIAKDVMHSPVITVKKTDTVRRAVDLMRRYDISQIPVVHGNRLVGSLQEATIVRKLMQSREPEKVFNSLVEEVMEKPFATVLPTTSLESVLELLGHGQPAVLVVDGGKLVGIIAKIDIISAKI
ncbi:CBS domain-containing protein [Candidatus Bathyarchaeota archaeon]|nr:CBS domain-containing protein [Candidatus Bathyarchaeota archaeon]